VSASASSFFRASESREGDGGRDADQGQGEGPIEQTDATGNGPFTLDVGAGRYMTEVGNEHANTDDTHRDSPTRPPRRPIAGRSRPTEGLTQRR
jgi:hypothetical protein